MIHLTFVHIEEVWRLRMDTFVDTFAPMYESRMVSALRIQF